MQADKIIIFDSYLHVCILEAINKTSTTKLAS